LVQFDVAIWLIEAFVTIKDLKLFEECFDGVWCSKNSPVVVYSVPLEYAIDSFTFKSSSLHD
jgi:hypothetical protein